MKVHCEVWVATALLHREQPGRGGFSRNEILERAHQQHPGVPCRPGVGIHISQHCVANTKPNPNDYRMLYRTPEGTFRLFRRGDEYHPRRANGRVTPRPEDLPARHLSLLDWYRSEYDSSGSSAQSGDPQDDPLLKLVGLGKELWKGLGGGDAVIRWLRSDTPSPPPWEVADSEAKRGTGRSGGFSEIWKRIRENEGRPFRTKTGRRFTYQLTERETLQPIARGRPVNRLLPKGDFEKAWRRFPVSGPKELQDLQGPSYVYGILTDKRIAA